MANVYHEFEVGFNWWYVIVPAFIIVMMVLGARKYFLKEMKIRSCDDGGMTAIEKYLAIVMAIITIALIAVESGIGIIQVLVNTGEHPFYVVLALVFAILLGLPLMYCLYFQAGKLGEWAKLGCLTEFLTLRKERQENRERRLHPDTTEVVYEPLDKEDATDNSGYPKIQFF